MKNYRENRTRGTPDCPFARYRFTHRPGGIVCAPIHWHPEAELLYMRHGEIEVRIGRNDLRLLPGDICFIPTNELHTIRTMAPANTYDAFVFSLDLVTLPEAHFLQRELIQPLSTGEIRFPWVLRQGELPYDTVAAALEQISSCSIESENYKLTVFSSVIQIFTAMKPLAEPCSAPTLHKGNDTIKDCLRYMDAHYADKLTLQDIADQVHLHPNYLCALFRKYTGQTIFEHLNQIRVEKAAKLLRTDDQSISQVAELCGFDSTSFFSRKFKQIMGTTPKAYSKQF